MSIMYYGMLIYFLGLFLGAVVSFLCFAFYFFRAIQNFKDRKSDIASNLFPIIVPFVSNLYTDEGKSYLRKSRLFFVIFISLFLGLAISKFVVSHSL